MTLADALVPCVISIHRKIKITVSILGFISLMKSKNTRNKSNWNETKINFHYNLTGLTEAKLVPLLEKTGF